MLQLAAAMLLSQQADAKGGPEEPGPERIPRSPRSTRNNGSKTATNLGTSKDAKEDWSTVRGMSRSVLAASIDASHGAWRGPLALQGLNNGCVGQCGRCAMCSQRDRRAANVSLHASRMELDGAFCSRLVAHNRLNSVAVAVPGTADCVQIWVCCVVYVHP